MNAVYVVPTKTPSDVSGIQKLIDEKVIAPKDIIAVLGKTEGNDVSMTGPVDILSIH